MYREGERLLGDATSTWNPKILIGAVVGTCVATFLLASATSTSTYTAPAVPAVAQSQSVVVASQPVSAGSWQRVQSGAALAAAADGAQEEYSSQAQSTWTPLAAMAALPMAVVGAVLAFRPSKKQAPLDPIDLLGANGTQWAMMATATGAEGAVARNYATALIELGQENKCLEQLHGDMDNFAGILEDGAFAEFFSNPLMVGPKQKEVIGKLCDEGNMSPITKNFLYFLVDKRRIPQLSVIIQEFDQQFFDVTGTQVATVTAAVPMNEEQLRLIANKLHEITKGKNIKIKSQVNPDLLAGFVLEYGKSGSQRIDLSLRGQLSELEADLKENVRKLISNGVPAGIQFAIAALGVNAILAGHASADSGNIFDFGLTLPIQMTQFLLLMVFLEKTVFTPVGKIIDERAAFIREKNVAGSDNTKEIAQLNAEAEALLEAAKRDAALEQEKAKKEAAMTASKMMADAKADLDRSLRKSLDEVKRSKDELWARLESEVLPQLADDIVGKLLGEEQPAAV